MQDDPVDYLPMAKLAANNYMNTLTRMTLFFANNSFHSCTSIEPLQLTKKTGQIAKLLTADQIIVNQKAMLLFLQDQLA